jgi:hypothetical protein
MLKCFNKVIILHMTKEQREEVDRCLEEFKALLESKYHDRIFTAEAACYVSVLLNMLMLGALCLR